MNREEQKYLIALGNLQNMAIDNTKGSKAVEICTNDIRTYVERLNNIIDETTKYVKSLSSSGRGCDIYDDIKKEILNKLKGDNK